MSERKLPKPRIRKVLITHRYFWPDTPPYGIMLKRIAERLRDEGLNVSVFSTKPSYHGTSVEVKGSTKTINGIKVRRQPVFNERGRGSVVRIINTLIYSISLTFQILRSRPDIVTVSTFPPVAAALSASLACRLVNASLIYHLMDVYPEVHWINSDRKRGIGYSALRWIDKKVMQSAWRIVVLSQDMQDTVSKRGLNKNKVIIINNLELEPETELSEEDIIKRVKELKLPNGNLKIMFSGNIGIFQALDHIAKLANKLSDRSDIHFIFLGDGRHRDHLRKILSNQLNKTVWFIDYQPVAIARELIKNVDLNLVSLSPGVSTCSFPSKTLTIASLGGAMLVLDDAESSLSRSVQNHNAGLIFSHSQLDKMAQALCDLADNPTQIKAYQSGASNLYNKELHSDIILERWIHLFKSEIKK